MPPSQLKTSQDVGDVPNSKIHTGVPHGHDEISDTSWRF